MTEGEIKAMLKNYIPITEEHVRYSIKLRELHVLRAYSIADTPKGPNVSRPTEKDAVIRLHILEQLTKIAEEIDATLSMVETLSNPLHRLVLKYKYVDGMEWSEVQEKLKKGKTACYKLHNEAIKFICETYANKDEMVR